MNSTVLLGNLEALIKKNVGVEIVRADGNEKYFRIGFTVVNPVSRLALVEAAGASNTRLNIWARFRSGSKEAVELPELSVQYEYMNNPVDESNENICWLGAHLTWIMYRSGAISEDEEKDYCEIFGAVSRS